jgi:hypothetical protein
MNNQFKYRPMAFAVLMAFPLLAAAEMVDGDLIQSSTNIGSVSNAAYDGTVPTIGSTGDGEISLGTNASISIGATGAAASVSISALNDVLPSPTIDGVTLNNITQTVNNGGAVTNQGEEIEFGVYKPVDISISGGSIGVGASTSVSASGAVASVSVSAISDGTDPTAIVLPLLGNITQAGDVIATPDEEYSSAYGGFTGAPLPKITNSNVITNNGDISGLANMDIGASASISASGAVASFSISAVSVEMLDSEVVEPMIVAAADASAVSQGVQNTGIINNTGAITFEAEVASAMLTAASLSVSATGAVAAVSHSFVNANLAGSWSSGDILQGADNTGSVTNAGTIAGNNTELGQAASVAVSATGAVTAVSFSAVNGEVTLPVTVEPAFFDVEQYVNNEGAISNSGKITSLDALGVGASASVSASGATASVSFNANNSVLASSEIGVVTQQVKNDATVANSGMLSTGNLDRGASVSVNATGAIASLTMSANGGSLAGLTAAFGDTTQTVTNLGVITNTADSDTYSGITAGNLGVGASASVSASGAVAAISITGLNATFTDSVALAGNYSQTVTNGGGPDAGAGDVTNGGVADVGSLDTGASASVSATGAVASLSVSSVSSEALTSVQFSDVTGTISQVVNNYGDISNTGKVTTVGDLSNGASVAVSASGAVASISMSALGGTLDKSASLTGAVTQNAENYGSVSNTAGSIIGTEITDGVSTGDLAGSGASASISASGAVASIGFNFNNASFGAEINSELHAITQTVESNGNVDNTGAMTVGALSGHGASASISASGAVASTSFSANNTDLNESVIDFAGAINQTVDNFGNVYNTGAMTAGSLSGHGASVSISASGAVASTSYSTNASTIANGSVTYSGNITQVASNYTSVTNAGNISLGTMSGKGSSASISATGAVSAFSVASTVDTGLSATTLGGSFNQTANNFGAVNNSGTISFSGPVTLANGASASISATGAATSVSFSSIK